MTAIRGAITVRANTVSDITDASVKLIKAIVGSNSIGSAINLIISSTNDITAAYPAKAIRESGLISAPIFSCAEPNIDGALPMCIRVLVQTNDDFEPKHIYLDGATILRPDITEQL